MKPTDKSIDPYKEFYVHHRKDFFPIISYIIDTQNVMIMKLKTNWKHRARKDAMDLMIKEIDLWRSSIVPMLQPYSNMRSQYFNAQEKSVFEKYSTRSIELEELINQFRVFFGMEPN